MHLYELLGAPLVAVIQAEAQAAQTSAEFIRRIGFDSVALPTPAETGADPSMLQEGGQLGQLRMASFVHPISGVDGKVRNHQTQIPVLSLFPLPLLQVKYGEFDFAVRIIEHSTAQAESGGDPQGGQAPPGIGDDAASSDFLSSHRVGMKAAVARQTSSEERRTEMQMKIKIRMEQADLPSGITKLLNLMDRSVNSSLQPGLEAPAQTS
jgi:hypothetical protein